jgi:NitT/TauT family transport system substrate-binding protein
MISAGLPVKIVLLLDQSNSADAILATKDILSIKDLKGKQVAYERHNQ